MLMNWSSSYPYEETQINQLKRKTRAKITNPKQLEDDELADFNPPPHPEIKKVEKYPELPVYDKPFEFKETFKNQDSVLLEKLNINEFSDFYMYPYINTFCRDPDIKYRGCGSILINYIFCFFPKFAQCCFAPKFYFFQCFAVITPQITNQTANR